MLRIDEIPQQVADDRNAFGVIHPHKKDCPIGQSFFAYKYYSAIA